MALSERRKGLTDDRLRTETVDCRAKTLIEVEAGQQSLVFAHCIDACAVNHSLHDVCRAKLPQSAGQHDVVGIMDLRLVIPRAGLTGKRQGVFAAPVGDGEEAFRDVYVGGAVLTHGPQLDQMCFGTHVAHGKQNVERAVQVVVMDPYSVFTSIMLYGAEGFSARCTMASGLNRIN